MGASTIRRLALAGVILGFVVVVLGAYVRLTAAGLGCPDWPGCYGHFTPAGAEAAGAQLDGAPMHVGKAWREMIHRYAAATLGLLIVAIAVLAVRSRRTMRTVLPLTLVGLVVFQGVLGALTVTWQLKPLIVTAHLAFGLLTVSLLWWLWLSLRGQPRAPQALDSLSMRDIGGARPRGVAAARATAIAALAALALQILLGGWTSSNYAAVACPDFPRCQDAWVPEAQYGPAFVLWRGLGINYEGGVLQHPARVAIHFVHRIGAVLAATILAVAAGLALRIGARGAGAAVLAALALQLLIGIGMVVRGFPLAIATAHNAGAALLLLASVLLVHRLRGQPARAGQPR